MIKLTAYLLIIMLSSLRIAFAHEASTGYMSIGTNDIGSSLTFTLDLHPRDLEAAVGLDANRDNQISWGEVKQRKESIQNYLAENFSLNQSSGEPCTALDVDIALSKRSENNFISLTWNADCSENTATVEVDYRLMANTDPQHRVLLSTSDTVNPVTLVINPSDGPRHVNLAAKTVSKWAAFADYTQHGLEHILIGWDHLLFVITLILPAVFLRSNQTLQPTSGFANSLSEATWVVTAFTAAHSITLALSVFGLITLPGRLVESLIAASVILVALNNLRPILWGKRWVFAFGFGLIHGLGFAGALAELGLPTGAKAVALLGFNVGVELGQLAIIGAALPIAFAFRFTWIYQQIFYRGGSIAVASLASWWLLNRLTTP